MARYKVTVNSVENIQDLLQEAYKLSDEQIVESQNEITKLSSATKLQEETIDGKEKYAKAINNYLSIKDKAISKKIEIAKLLTEIYKHNGDIERTLNDSNSMKSMSFDFSKIKELVNNQFDDKKKTERITLKNQ